MKLLGRLLLALGFVSVLFVPSVVSAFTSTSFETKAAQYIAGNCNNPSTASTEQAYKCFVYARVYELSSFVVSIQNTLNNHEQRISTLETKSLNQAAAITDLQNRVQVLEHQAQPGLYDASNHFLGYSVGSNEFYIPSFNRDIFYNPSDGVLYNNANYQFAGLSYPTSDCSGQAYVYSYDYLAHTLINVVAQNQYYIIPDSSGSSYFGPLSQSSDGIECHPAGPNGSPNNYYPVTKISLPFSDPLQLPLNTH